MAIQYGYPGYSTNIQSGTNDINGVPKVSSIDEVKAATVLYGITLFIDANNNLLYAKNSQGLIKAYKLEEVALPSTNPQDFVTKDEFDNLRRQYEQLAQQYAASSATTATNESIANDAGNAELPGITTTSQGTILQANSGDGINGISTQQSIG